MSGRLSGVVARWLARRSQDRRWVRGRRSAWPGTPRTCACSGRASRPSLVRKVGFGLLGPGVPAALATLMGVIGLRLPWPVPALAAVVFAAVLFLLPDLDVRRRADAVRVDLRAATAAYLELVALERAADAGAGEALERAATIGATPAFTRIRDALTRARLDGAPAWQGLARLGEASGVAELDDVADIMRLSGQDGAAVYATLRARATSLRTARTTQAAAAANAASEHMVIPVGLLGLVFLALLGYPAFSRIVFGA